MFTYLMIALSILLVIYLLNKTAFRRIADAGGAQVGKGAKALWAYDPIAVKNAEIDRKSDEVSKSFKSLTEAKALALSVQRQVDYGEIKVKKLQALAEQYVKEGNDEKALEKLAEVEEVSQELEENKKQLKIHKDAYANFLAEIQQANKRIGELRKEAKSQGARLEMAKAKENLAKLAPTFGKTNFNNFDEIDEEIEAQINKRIAAGETHLEVSKEGIEEIEVEEKIRKEAAKDKLQQLKEKLGDK